MRKPVLIVAACLGSLAPFSVAAADPTPKAPLSLTVSNGTKTVSWPLIPALDGLRFTVGNSVTNVTGVSNAAVTRGFAGYAFSLSNALPMQFYSLQLTQMNTNAL